MTGDDDNDLSVVIKGSVGDDDTTDSGRIDAHADRDGDLIAAGDGECCSSRKRYRRFCRV